ncbi:DNA helicase-2 / ATP-dependent DNA helicase PcrA [Hathewaya proteolytica DSM 3090]|uniref:DNA 3'-5' helicase n=1 Tax=Hathewaya proteolytica DSM 3090 TaxID=1121331 RepID=A0A1M6LGK9_9CLOT|nr:ATP-dependent helicase [Hathewaya proteolytica]SHJ70235.1 DNA helicase-2 / ATP-dependent DNA helicase PcrA [Hathewaya proteolytica DSM 3090]
MYVEVGILNMINLDSLDREQVEAVKNEKDNILVIAAPGSGKTTTIINRVNYFQLKGVSRDNIIIITFTKAAAQSMKSRYERLTGRECSPFFGTFHSLFYRLLKRLDRKFDIMPEDEARQVIKKELTKIYDEVSEDKMRDILNLISFFKSSNTSLEEFHPEGCNSKVFSICYESYEQYRKSKNYYDFDDLEKEMYSVLKSNKNILKSYSKLFKYILVDEFQDCDNLQISILQMFSEEGSKVFAVGDEDQCIYGFRGARPDAMVDFHEKFKNGFKTYLGTNYRCPKNVVEYSSALICNNVMRNKKRICSNRSDDGKVVCNLYITEREQAFHLARYIKNQVENHEGAFSHYAILYRTNEESRVLIDTFTKSGIPFNVTDKGYNFYDNFICRDILNYLKLSINMCDKELFCSVINKPFRYVGRNVLLNLREYPYKENCFNIVCNLKELKVFQIKDIKSTERYVNNLNRMSLKGAINSVMQDLGYKDYLKSHSEKFKIPMDELLFIVSQFVDSAEEFKSIDEFIQHIESVKKDAEIKKENRKKIEEAVLLSTIHGVKGMEFPHVFIVNCNEEILPYGQCGAQSDLEEERRIFYVGITRSINTLHLSYVKSRLGKPMEPSRFLKEINVEVEDNTQFSLNDKVIHQAFGTGVVKNIKKKTVTVLFEDKIQRKFDAQIVIDYGLLKKVW